MLVSMFAREYVKVALSADAGDELFAGYSSYPDLIEKLNWMNQIPQLLKQPSAFIFSGLSSFVPFSRPVLKHKLDGLSRALNHNRFQQAADLFRITNSLPKAYMNRLFIRDAEDYKTKFNLMTSGFHYEAEVSLAIDYQSYLQNDILSKVDRATMSVSLEGREPLVDHRLLEFAARMPFEYKYDGISTKRILKDIVHEYVPMEMMDRPKSGFSLPIYSWLRGDLSYLLDEHLNEEELYLSGLFDVTFLLKQVELFKKGKLHHSQFIFKLLMFQMWHKKWME
jgi:asparagine synthase (glutamine-hydrolysing)